LVSGILLVLLGIAILALQILPGWLDITISWPVIIILIGLGLLVLGLFTTTPDLAIPACIVSGIGGILYIQDTNLLPWESWGYLWTLVPGFVGLGELISGLIKGKRKQMMDGLETMVVSGVLFVIFGSLLGDIFGDFALGQYLPVILIGLGIFLLIRSLITPRK
jgi:hypothetical protein